MVMFLVAFLVDIVRHVLQALSLGKSTFEEEQNKKVSLQQKVLIIVHNTLSVNLLLFAVAWGYSFYARLINENVIACASFDLKYNALLLYYVLIGSMFILVVISVCFVILYFNLIRN